MVALRRGLAAPLILVLSGTAPTTAATPMPGKAIFDRRCAECHAAGHGHPGTQQLGWLRGPKAALLEDRRDLTPLYVTTVVRRGLVEMPPFRPTEIDDRELADLAAWLTRPRPTLRK